MNRFGGDPEILGKAIRLDRQSVTVIGILPDEIGNSFRKAYWAKFGEKAEADPGASTYSETYHYAIAAALAGGTGEPGKVLGAPERTFGTITVDKNGNVVNTDQQATQPAQNSKSAASLKRFVYRAPFGVLRYAPEFNAAIPYPTVSADPSIAMPHLLYQIKDPTAEVPKKLIFPEPYNEAGFELPPWFA